MNPVNWIQRKLHSTTLGPYTISLEIGLTYRHLAFGVLNCDARAPMAVANTSQVFGFIWISGARFPLTFDFFFILISR